MCWQYVGTPYKWKITVERIDKHLIFANNKMIIMDTLTYYKIKKMSPLFLVADINFSIKFYTDKLNFDVDFRYEDFYAGIIKDGYSIHLKVSDYSVEKRKNKKNNEDINITFLVSNIEVLYEELSHKSIEIVQTLRVMPYGKEFYVADPDGNIISFLEEA